MDLRFVVRLKHLRGADGADVYHYKALFAKLTQYVHRILSLIGPESIPAAAKTSSGGPPRVLDSPSHFVKNLAGSDIVHSILRQPFA